MRRAAPALAPLALAWLAACGHPHRRPYANGDPRLLARYTAKELCSCLFVMGQSEAFCAAWTRTRPNLKTSKIDREQKLVRTRAVVLFTAKARYRGPEDGCVAEE